MKQKKYISSLLLSIVFIFGPFSPLIAAEKDVIESKTDKKPISLSVDYFYPPDKSRNIDTINFNAYYPIKEFKKIELILYGGLTCTFASGDITQLEGELSEGTSREVKSENEAFGVGPGLWADFAVLNSDRISFNLVASGNLNPFKVEGRSIMKGLQFFLCPEDKLFDKNQKTFSNCISLNRLCPMTDIC